ncbi:HEAT repeat domain-containing protein [Streptomyces mirabilis]|nr:HEAT repeat domain-containing protein [Streptomyces mirabilis]
MAGPLRRRDRAVRRGGPARRPALARALEDPNADVRKATVLALVQHSAIDEEARAALATATADSDADVRAYASRAL